MDQAHLLATFLSQLIILMVVGRILGEVMARIGQPAIFGQLLAGVVLGPSLFGVVLPALHGMIFPDSDDLKKMIDAISQVGILLLLLLTGMETNIQLVRRRFRVVVTTSLAGIAVPFICGLALGYLLPDALIPDEGRRLVTALFIGTALSISSVKIVAIVLMEVGFIRRDLGQLILATAILDDSIAWILVSVIAGMAARGSVDLGQIGFSIAAAVFFLTISLTIGRKLVAGLIRWSNDNLSIEFPVITAVLVVTFSMALLTDLIGVHSALGAFIAGVIIGQAPILKGHIEQELRGLILAFFSPVFFAVAGLGMDLTMLADPVMLGLAVAFVAIASIGKTTGALIGGRLAGLSGRESLALATGLNARGSTEVIIATIGVTLGVLSAPLYTLIVAMAIITTMIMPPSLRWALSRVPMRDDEHRRLEKEEAAGSEHLSAMERVLVMAAQGRNAALSLRLAGAFAVGRQILTTVLEEKPTVEVAADGAPETGTALARQAATEVERRLTGIEARGTAPGTGQNEAESKDQPDRMPIGTLIRRKESSGDNSGEAEALKGYSIMFAGLDKPLDKEGRHFNRSLADFLEATDIPVGICVTSSSNAVRSDLPRHILVPTDGTQVAGLATEIAVALARAMGSKLTVLHVIEQARENDMLRRLLPEGEGDPSVLHQASTLARRHAVKADLSEVVHPHPDRVLRRLVASGSFDLVVIGADLREDGGKFLGPRTSKLLRSIRAPVLLIAK